ncbi:MFS transporter [Paenibacillus ehimensis]|uniref:MFS transporter n=1 Tax=Paenibacillus ehimensis TaxID=79264 RepID=A0ABT8V473_9BACL|nr:nitrate/nitrite transporter [Paenibacillus ehimensis]MDO3676227.1 MFS transporter [Paenibacillus ehimensis]MEC0210092.1 MFS transporter [Paenibacillus ehimensis]
MDVRKLQLPLQTVSLILGFAVWVILSSLMPFIKSDIPMTPGQLSWVTAVPVILGSVLRIPIGFWTNKYGARKLFAISFVLLLFPVYYVSQATTFVDLLIGGFFLGIGGAVFSVGVTSLPKYYPKEKHGSVNGLYGIGNLGTAVSAFGAPVVASSIGWSATVQLYLVLLAVFVLLHVFLGDRKEPKVVTPVREQMKEIYRNPRLWAISLFYFITFGCFVAFTIYLPNFLVSHFQLAKADAGFRTAVFIAIATAARPVGGWLGDKFNSFVILMFVFGGLTLSGILLSFSPDIQLYTVGCLLIAVCAGTGNGTIFKLVPLYFLKQAGIVNGIVSAMGGLGGFFPPLILASLLSLTGHYAIGFMALSEFALVSLVLVFWMYYQDRLHLAAEIIENTAEAIVITDLKGTIRQVNPAFTKVTGYTQEEIIGENPRILKSGKQPSDFYAAMWKTIKEKGFWQGEIWNRRKNGDEYLQWLTISAIKNDAGEVKHYAGMFSDISELRNK